MPKITINHEIKEDAWRTDSQYVMCAHCMQSFYRYRRVKYYDKIGYEYCCSGHARNGPSKEFDRWWKEQNIACETCIYRVKNKEPPAEFAYDPETQIICCEGISKADWDDNYEKFCNGERYAKYKIGRIKLIKKQCQRKTL